MLILQGGSGEEKLYTLHIFPLYGDVTDKNKKSKYDFRHQVRLQAEVQRQRYDLSKQDGTIYLKKLI